MYATGTPLTMTDIVNAVAAFLPTIPHGTGLGWVVDRLSTRVDGQTRELLFHCNEPDGSVGYFQLTRKILNSGSTYYEALLGNGSTSYNGANDSESQFQQMDPPVYATMSVGASSSPPGVAPVRYHLMGDAQSLFLAIQVAADDYQTLGFQRIAKSSTWTGGSAVLGSTATDPSGFAGNYHLSWHADGSNSYTTGGILDGGTWRKLGVGSGTLWSNIAGQGQYSGLISASWRDDTDGRVALPFIIFMHNDTADTSWPAGVLRRCALVQRQGLTASEVIQIGAVNYLVLPGKRWDESRNNRIALQMD